MRVLVMLGADLYDPEVLQTVAHLAAALDAELHGLFIEDTDVFRLAALPVAREISYPTATERLLQTQTLERTYRRLAQEVRERLFEQARRVRVRCSFEVVRGRRPHSALGAAEKLDIVVMTGDAEIRVLRTATLGDPRVRRRPRPVMAVFDGSEAGRRTVATGRLVAAQLGAPLLVAFAVSASKTARDAAREALRHEAGDAPIVDLDDTDLAGLARAARRQRAALILLSRGDAAAAERLARLAGCFVALLHSETSSDSPGEWSFLRR